MRCLAPAENIVRSNHRPWALARNHYQLADRDRNRAEAGWRTTLHLTVTGGENDMFDVRKLFNALTKGTSGANAQAVTETAKESFERAERAAADVTSQASATVAGALEQARDRLQGTQAAAYIDKARELVGKNPGATTAALTGLAALLLGTKGGRDATMGAAKLGGLAAIGAVAYKALRNHQEGRPLGEGVPGLEQLTAAPEDSPFSEAAHTKDSALLLVRTMIAAAAADGVVDSTERVQILKELEQSGLESEAAQFLDNEVRNPVTIADIVEGVGSSKDLALQAYAAANLVATSTSEKSFLADLGKALALDPDLVARIGSVAAAAPASMPR
jgi:uncharacterized membrane protein YebE (DUF533 family)